MQQIYEVPIVPQNLRREETIVQIVETVNYLSDVCDDIFNRINERIVVNNAQMSNISNRVSTASGKLSKLAGAKKATQVFSSSKYPAADVNRQYISIFNANSKLPVKRFPYKYKNIHTKDEQLETLQFYHVKTRNTSQKMDNVGLGSVPNDVNMVNDLLLFNSGINPYNKYVMCDTLQGTQVSRKEDPTKDTNEMCAAPLSISEGAASIKTVAESYLYSPDLGNVPLINVPLDLPDLPGIADDLRYVTEVGPGISPSVTTTPIAAVIPTISEDTPDNNIPNLPPVEEEEIEAVTEVALSVSVPLHSEPDNASTTVTEFTTKPVLLLPDASTVHSTMKTTETNFSTVKVPVESNNARASLMEAIRKAGGAKKLKSMEASSETGTKSPASKTVGGDLMSDLHAKLSMRRKGISGIKGEGSAMDKVSAMIPPPMPKPGDLSENTEDEEWED